ncbi:MAG: VWA domain-containing protein [Candidatus Sericytochromatia bacterium]|nr:VWA domain-containing protein [Candidatus Sericytochromatia bacterium]
MLKHTPLVHLGLAIGLSLSLLACQPGETPGTGPAPSAFPEVAGTPPPIPSFAAQPIPTAMPGRNFDGGDAMAEAGMPMSAPAMMDSVSAGPATSERTSSSAPRPGVTAPDIMPPILPPEEPGPVPEAGLLTAGAWSDLQNWPFWLDLMQQQEWDQMPATWGIYTQRRVPVVVRNSSGQALADVPVTLRSGQQTLFTARTNMAGEAELFVDLFTAQSQYTDLQIRADSGQAQATQDLSWPLQSNEPIGLSLESEVAPAVYADLMLMIDTTGSMGDELEYLKSELANVASRVAAQTPQDLTLRLSANFYRDTTDEYVVRSFPFSTDVNSVQSQLAQQSANGGGDFPEAVDSALADAVDNHQWSPTARARLLFLVLDAPPHQDAENLQRLRTSLERAAAKGIRIIPVASSGIDKDTEFLLRMLAISSGGQYVFLTDDSGIGNSHIKPTIGQYSVEKLNDLMVRLASAYINGDF